MIWKSGLWKSLAMGVIAGLVPSTNPTSTVFAKVCLPSNPRRHYYCPTSAAKCILEATRLMLSRVTPVPQGLIGRFEKHLLQGTGLMQHKYIVLILATGAAHG